MRNQVHQKYGGRCAYCGEEITLKQMQVDHIIPKRNYSETHGCLIVGCQRFEEYGLNDIRNLNPACRSCNKWKSAMTLDDFRSEIAAQVDRLRRYRNQFRLAERFGQVEATGKQVILWLER